MRGIECLQKEQAISLHRDSGGLRSPIALPDLNRPLIEGTERGKMLKWHTPMGRFGEAEELVGAAIYLASPSASYTSGHTIIVDGGFLSKGV